MTADLVFYDPNEFVDIFLHSLTKLRVQDGGLAGGHDMGDLNCISMLCAGIKLLGNVAGRNVEDVLLCSLAEHTERLLMTAVIPAEDDDVVKDWLRAQAELLSCRLSGL